MTQPGQPAPQPGQPTARPVALTVNGEPRVVHTDPDTPLLYVLRNELGLMAARFGCGLGLCGACFVHVDGAVVASCDTPMWSVEAKAVTTVEGLAPAGVLHPVQQAVLDEQAAQCAYCITGVIMSGAALLQRRPQPSEAEVAEALERNLCRCGAHGRMVRAVLRAGRATTGSTAGGGTAAGGTTAGRGTVTGGGTAAGGTAAGGTAAGGTAAAGGGGGG